MKKVYCKPVMESEEFNVRQHVATSCNHHCHIPQKLPHQHPKTLNADEEVDIVEESVNYDEEKMRIFGCHWNWKDGHKNCHHGDIVCKWHS